LVDKYLPSSLSSYVDSLLYSPHETFARERKKEFLASGHGYYQVQSTKPATLGYALYDNPLGQLAYIGEKYHEWVDPNFRPTKEDIVNTVAIYYLTQSFHTASLPYFESAGKTSELVKLHARIGLSVFKWDIMSTPKSWVAGASDLLFYREHSKGGHFPHLEQPDVLATDIRLFIIQFWSGDLA